MTEIQRQVRKAQHRLWANHWFEQCCWLLAGAAGAFGAVVLIDRLYGLGWPLGYVALALFVVAITVATIWTYLVRTTVDQAAVALDEAAALRERISSGLYCEQDPSQQSDEFARAVVADAQRVGRSLTVRLHVRLRAPFTLVYTSAAVVAALLLLLLPSGILARDATEQQDLDSEAIKHTKVVVQRKLAEVKKLVETNPALKDLKEDLDRLDEMSQVKPNRPEDVRHEAIKKIERMSDALKERRNSEKFDQVQQTRKLLRTIKSPSQTTTTVQKLQHSLAQGDFKSAKEQVKALQEQLARLKSPQDAAKLKEMQKQLEALAKKLEFAAQDQKLAQKLEQAGLKKEDIERMLKQLSKKDLDQLRKQLQDQGLAQKDIDSLLQQLAQRQQACSKCTRMSQAMQQAADAAALGQTGDAISQLDAASDQLSELEQLEQEMNQLDSTMAQLQNSMDELDNPCGACNGTGQVGGKPCGRCQGRGAGMGRLGQGRGGLAPEEETAVGFKVSRSKVHTTKGRIIGQSYVDGQQIKGDVSSELAETITAAEREATDLIYRDRIPRQYQKSVKEYFSTVRRDISRAPVVKDGASTGGDAEGNDGAADIETENPSDQ